MSNSIIISALARKHLKESFEWYEAKKLGLGDDFRNEVRLSLDKFVKDQVDYQIYRNGIRKITLNKFPYYIYYKREALPNEIVILAVLHFKRNPADIKKLLGQ